jgi:hypothetical protein
MIGKMLMVIHSLIWSFRDGQIKNMPTPRFLLACGFHPDNVKEYINDE